MRKILGLLVLISGLAFGQEIDTIAMDTVRQIPNYFGGVYFEIGAKLAPNPPSINQTNFIGGGVQYNRWSVGFMVSNFQGTTERFVIFPNVFSLEYKYGGPNMSFDVIQSDWVRLATYASFELGDMTWRNESDDEDFLRSEFNMLTFGAKAEMSKLRFIRPYLNAGYQKMSALDLSGVEDEEFSGFFLGVGLRIGYFNQ